MLVILIVLVTIAVAAAFAAGVFLGAAEAPRVTRMYRNARTMLRTVRRVERGHCDLCRGHGLIVDATIEDGSGGCTYCWWGGSCRRRMRRAERERQARIADLGRNGCPDCGTQDTGRISSTTSPWCVDCVDIPF